MQGFLIGQMLPHLVFDRLSKFHQLDGVAGELLVLDGFGDPGDDVDRFPGVVDGDEDNDAVGGLLDVEAARITRADVDGDVHAGTARVDNPGADLDHVTDMDRLVEAYPADVDGDTILAAPADSARIAGLVDPLHDRAAVNLPAEVDVGGLGEESERNFTSTFGHAPIIPTGR